MLKRLPDILEDMRQALLGRGVTDTGSAETDSASKGMVSIGKSLSQKSGEAYRKAKDGLKGFGTDTLKRTAQEFNNALPYIERAGYEVTAIEVGLGISPRIISELKLCRTIDDAEKQALLEEVRGETLKHTILSALFSASSVRDKLKFNRFHFAALELEVSVLPVVSLRFMPDKNAPGGHNLIESKTELQEETNGSNLSDA